ncbi:tubulin-like doman-containing protein [Sphingomonas sp. LT1P40]|uniref:tubulin-like doman-containing protein n=1 Tax=Alteristakelama amylovorans TaxID=3096166 RepID=UPI002FCC4118
MNKTVHVLLGVGGTGAKVVEAALMMMAAGVGPRNVHVGLIDQDNSNGNVARTRQLLSNLVDFQHDWSANEMNRVDWIGSAPPAFGSVKVHPLFKQDKNALWCPTRTQGTLRSIVGENLDEAHEHLFDLMFMEGPEEQDLPLSKGYRGRAHVGATALVASLVDGESVLLKRLTELMEDANRNQVNIFVVGSAFGGTGAAGFPTLARALNRIRNASDFKNAGKVSLGGMLMLPYFQFHQPPADAVDAVVTSDELLPKAKLALEYYNNLLAHEATFDRFYALGWEQLFNLGYHEPGSAEQQNPALAPEIFAASAIFDFFDRPREEEGEAKAPVMVSARQDREIRWRDLPYPDLEARLGQMLRFAVYWRFVVEPALSEKKLIGKNWAQKLAGDARAIDSEVPLNLLRELIDDILLWAMTIEHTGGEFWRNGPWQLADLKDPSHVPTPTTPVALRGPAMQLTALHDAFDHLIRTDAGEFLPRAGHELHDELTRAKPPAGDHRGIGRTVAAVYAAASMR